MPIATHQEDPASHLPQPEDVVSFPLYLLGAALVIGGICWGLALAHLATTYIIIAGVIMLGLAVLSGVSHTRQKDPPA